MQKIIVLTFDYELFFKKSGTLQNCILKPVDVLLELFKKYQIKATFFIDVLYYLRLAENAETIEDSKLLKDQLQRLVLNGHRIELHLHPHWLDAKYENGYWLFPTYEHYQLQSLPQEKINDLFISGKQILEDIAQKIDKTYKVIAFRAGGFNIQPFDKYIEAFKKCNLKIDSSVAPGSYNKSKYIHNFDFRNAPRKSYYKFSNDPIIEDKDGEFLEIPISVYKQSLFDFIYKKIHSKYCTNMKNQNNNKFGDGEGIDGSNGIQKLFKKICTDSLAFNLEDRYLNCNHQLMINKINQIKAPFVNFISHPKSLSQNSITCIKKLANYNFKFMNFEMLFKDFLTK